MEDEEMAEPASEADKAEDADAEANQAHARGNKKWGRGGFPLKSGGGSS